MPVLFASRCERLLEMAAACAGELGHEYVGLEHLLCASLNVIESQNIGFVLSLGISANEFQALLGKCWPPSPRSFSRLPFSPKACNCIADVLRGCFAIRGHRVNCLSLVESLVLVMISDLTFLRDRRSAEPNTEVTSVAGDTNAEGAGTNQHPFVVAGITIEKLEAFLRELPELLREDDELEFPTTENRDEK